MNSCPKRVGVSLALSGAQAHVSPRRNERDAVIDTNYTLDINMYRTLNNGKYIKTDKKLLIIMYIGALDTRQGYRQI